jgi:hypothetical protein
MECPFKREGMVLLLSNILWLIAQQTRKALEEARKARDGITKEWQWQACQIIHVKVSQSTVYINITSIGLGADKFVMCPQYSSYFHIMCYSLIEIKHDIIRYIYHL